MSQLKIARWTVHPDRAYDGTDAPLRPEFIANVFEAMSWLYGD